eukprot:5170555-Amphidinium_carterae.1
MSPGAVGMLAWESTRPTAAWLGCPDSIAGCRLSCWHGDSNSALQVLEVICELARAADEDHVINVGKLGGSLRGDVVYCVCRLKDGAKLAVAMVLPHVEAA